MSVISSANNIQKCKVAFIVALFMPCLSNADNWLFEDYNYLELNMEQMHGMGLLPLGMMDDKSLLAAAEAERNGHSLDGQLKMNLYWLTGSEANADKVRKHANERLRSTLRQLLMQNEEIHFRDSLASESQLPFWKSFEPYRLKLRDDGIALNIVVAF